VKDSVAVLVIAMRVERDQYLLKRHHNGLLAEVGRHGMGASEIEDTNINDNLTVQILLRTASQAFLSVVWKIHKGTLSRTDV
jgi:hypothetical protein